MLFDGNEVHIHGPKDAAKLGIEVVYQDLALCDNLDVVQNMYLGREAHDWLQRLKEPVMEAKTAETMKSLAVTTIRSIRQPVATLSGGQRQSVAVARAVMWNSRLVILDEPTAALGVAQTQQVLELVERLAHQGLAVVLISHNLHDIFAVADRITVLRLGRNIAIYEREQDDAAGGRAGDHRRRADEGLGNPADRAGAARMSTDAIAAAPGRRYRRASSRAVRDNIRGGNLGSWPVLIGLAVIVIFFSFKADNFLSPGNFSNIITQMAGTTLLAYGVVFVLLIGEIDLSISYISGIAGVVVGKLTIPDGNEVAGMVAILLAIAVCTLIGAFQGSFVAFIGVPAFVVTLAGYQIWQGVIQKSIEAEGVIVIQDSTVNNTANYFFSETAGWIIAAIVLGIYIASVADRRRLAPAARRRRSATRGSSSPRSSSSSAATIFVVVVSNRDRGVPFVLLLMIAALLVLTFVAKRTTFGRHVYAVGGNAEAARRSGINVARVRFIVFMISGAMAGLGGVVLAARLNSVDLNAGGGTLLIDAIAAAVIGGTSLFGGRGEVGTPLRGARDRDDRERAEHAQPHPGRDLHHHGRILLFAVTLDTILRRRQRKAGR